MAVTISFPHAHRPGMQRLAIAGVAVLAAAIAVTGYQAVTNNNNTTTNSVQPATSGVAVDASPVTGGANPAAAAAGVGATITTQLEGVVDTSALADWAQANGLTGSSPTSVGAIATTSAAVVTPEQAAREVGMGFFNSQAPASAVAEADWTQFTEALRAIELQYLAGVPLGPDTASVHTQSGGFATRAQFLEANVDSYAVAPPTGDVHIGGHDMSFSAVFSGLAALETVAPDTASVHTQSGGFATQAQFLEANVDSYAAAPATATTEAPFDPYPETPATEAIQPRSNFASDLEWIEANGWG